MIIVGLTGSIGMGKTTAAQAFRKFGVPVYDADAEVHKLMMPGGKAVAAVAKIFPGARATDPSGRDFIDRSALAGLVFGDDAALKRLEGILHPLAGQAKARFLAAAARRRDAMVVLDIPLLLETGGDNTCDVVVVVTAPPFVQAQRVLKRPGMTMERFRQILDRQLPDLEKRQRADFIVQTGLGRAYSLRAIARIVKIVRCAASSTRFTGAKPGNA